MSKVHDIGTRGIIINRFSSGEGSVRVHIFTESFGLISALAQSVREERSKLRPHLQVGTFGYYDLVRGARSWRVVGAVETKNYYFSHGNQKVQSAAARVLSLLRQLVTGEERDESLFRCVWNFFSALSFITNDTAVRAERFVVLQILAALGYVAKEAVPTLEEEFDYSVAALHALESFESDMRRAIKNGFVASGLI